MEWWQIILILIAAVVTGGLVGTLISYLILRFVKKGETTFLSDLMARFPKRAEAPPPVVKAKDTFAAPDLLTEVKNNYQIATEPVSDNLATFQTDVWDAHHYQMDRMPAELRDDLEQVYTDIRLANSLAWLSTEFSRRTPSLDENYSTLRNSIYEKLDRIVMLLEQQEQE